jgi:hypothetical protein
MLDFINVYRHLYIYVKNLTDTNFDDFIEIENLFILFERLKRIFLVDEKLIENGDFDLFDFLDFIKKLMFLMIISLFEFLPLVNFIYFF